MILLALLVATAPVNTVKLQESGSAKVGSAAPSFGGWDLAGRKVLTLDGLRRTPSMAPLLITFGASWCKPCNAGLPRLRALAGKHPELRLVLIDVEADGQKAQDFATRTGVDGPAILDKFEQIAKTYGVAGSASDGNESMALPRTFLVDTMGKVRAIYREEGVDLEAVIEADLEASKTAVRPASAVDGK
jgi:peroxiredoxin